MIAVADNGPLEGLLRHFLGHFDSFCIPPTAAFRWLETMIKDIVGHQYVPGVFPWSFPAIKAGVHHVEHHYLQLWPLGNGFDEAQKEEKHNNCQLDTWLSDGYYTSKNKTWAWYVGESQRLEAWAWKDEGQTKGAAQKSE